MSSEFYIYILTNKYHNVLYIGVTNDLIRRVYEHKSKLLKGFTNKYNIDKLVYYEVCADIDVAILREKQIKKFMRYKKNDLIAQFNPSWKDLYDEVC